MKILGIETSCDETAVCIVEAEGSLQQPTFKILGDALFSQAKIHEEYGGVFPMLAKREHTKNIGPLLEMALRDAGLYKEIPPHPSSTSPFKGGDVLLTKLQKILEREQGLFEVVKNIIEKIEKPDIDYISVTAGPGLEPALWVGINFAQALGEAWNISVLPTNHMEGHIVSPLLSHEENKIKFPALALLISGGHTELVLIKNWLEYTVIGKTRDDAVGEAFDKVARLLSLPYPGGPHISKLAEEARLAHTTPVVKLPRPMITTKDYDFSFSGIKTAVLYALKIIPDITLEIKKEFALEFENAVTEVLISKAKKAMEAFTIKTLILGGGVVANTYIRKEFQNMVREFGDVKLLIPAIKDSTDNAVMIAAAAYLHILSGTRASTEIKAQGNLSL
jgi:N6-L-threonylcarbamoyladenine synthase